MCLFWGETMGMRNAWWVWIGCLCLAPAAFAEWRIPQRIVEVRVDGSLDEWQDVPSLLLAPDAAGLRSGGEFSGPQDVRVTLQGQWDEEHLYLAVTWQDDRWDVEEVRRRDAVWLDPRGKRRDRMLFFDYLKFHIREADYDYVLWLSPRAEERGPYFWCRLLEGYRGMERASMNPLVTARLREDGTVQTELMFFWKELRKKPDEDKPLPVTLILADSDSPGAMLDTKLERLKWLAWLGALRFVGGSR
ncbi:MAG: hypothetical protein Kow00109_10650 [Acidobacteriota bacterium]